jgi:hypothetical protein
MFKKAAVLVVSCGALLAGCGTDVQSEMQSENDEIIANLKEVGYKDDDIQVVDGSVYVGGDAHVTLQASREMLQSEEGQEQYRTTNLVSLGITSICLNPSPAYAANTALSNALNLAIENYNQLGLTFRLFRGTGCQATINITTTSGAGGSAGFPANGLPYPQIFIGVDTPIYGLDTTEHVVTHEIGHCVGLRHSDWYNRSISCGIGGAEVNSPPGAIHIPGTPTTAVVGGSIMNACFRASETGEFTSSDRVALQTVY